MTGLLRIELDWIVMKALEKDRARRYESANGFAADIQRYLTGEAVQAHPPSPGYRMRKFVRRHRGRALAIGLLAAMLFLVVGMVLYGFWWSERQSAERRHEKALMAASNNDAFKAMLDRTEAAVKAARLAEAETLLDQSGQQIDEQTPADLRERREKIAKDWLAIRDLNDIFEERWLLSPSDIRMDDERARRRYPALFRGHGLAVGREPAAQIVETLQRSLIAEALSTGLTEWFFVEPDFPGLLAVVDLLDPEPTRTALRGAIARGDRIEELSKKIDGSQLSPAYAIGLGLRQYGNRKAELQILKAAWRTHPSSFPLALTITIKSATVGDDAIHWGRIAVALRPNNALARYYYAVALSHGREDSANAIDEFYEAIRLAPRFARAYGRLAYKLHWIPERKREAMDAARKAIDLDDQSLLGHVIVCSHLLEDKNHVEAARLYRRLDELKSVGNDDQHYGEEQGIVSGFRSYSIEPLVTGLTAARRPFEAYRLADGKPLNLGMFQGFGVSGREYYVPARAAVLSGTGQGLDAPPFAERPAIRKHALEWLNANLDIWKKDAAVLPVMSAGSVGLMGSPHGHGSFLLAAYALSSGSPGGIPDLSKNEAVHGHDEMNRWLSDPDLAGVRDEQWLAKLPNDEQEQWRKFWEAVRSLRDRTASRKVTPPVGK